MVVVDDNTYYWVYWSSDHHDLFQVYYKVRQVLLQSATAFSLQSATSVITTCESVTILLQGATGITKYDRTIISWKTFWLNF